MPSWPRIRESLAASSVRLLCRHALRHAFKIGLRLFCFLVSKRMCMVNVGTNAWMIGFGVWVDTNLRLRVLVGRRIYQHQSMHCRLDAGAFGRHPGPGAQPLCPNSQDLNSRGFESKRRGLRVEHSCCIAAGFKCDQKVITARTHGFWCSLKVGMKRSNEVVLCQDPEQS